MEILPRDTPEVPGLLKFINVPVLQALDYSGVFSTSSLSAFFQRSPTLESLELELSRDTQGFTRLEEILYYCPSLLSLVIKKPKAYLFTSSDALLRAFVSDGERGYLCPRLHTFIFNWEVNASVDCIRQFLVGKRKGHSIAG
ncbi:hypothetical protein HYPSUDRAFT_619938 [Hypholoma sublateritium FD-334 SS-4]|uniref:F-box domain-containing protein n=1 Tax=Hypholoma sublateritium (strain FD-334 SS-4) TaxID=945553 RepID=A0A0D2LLH6_HYPSF|nr:hypothetical protein HYPSUDRAFT_619938 [Hypholoma sublateritium FD-334 SS-4]